MKIDKIPSMIKIELPKPCCDCQFNRDMDINVSKFSIPKHCAFEYRLEINCLHQHLCKYLENYEKYKESEGKENA